MNIVNQDKRDKYTLEPVWTKNRLKQQHLRSLDTKWMFCNSLFSIRYKTCKLTSSRGMYTHNETSVPQSSHTDKIE